MHLPSSFTLYLLAALESLSWTAQAQTFDTTSLVGTWTTKSGKVLTGPGFYNPVNETMIEPSLTGISYSFTADGYYEEALFRAISNPTTPSCTSAIMQWQHGTYTVGTNTTLGTPNLQLTPFAVDGRQIYSSPCTQKSTVLTRYNMTENFSELKVYVDPYNQQWRLDLFQWDGTPVNPMWLAMKPPQMLPTTTLNPTATATGSAATSTATAKVKRSFTLAKEKTPSKKFGTVVKSSWLHGDVLFWLGITMTAIGGIVVYCC